MSVSGSEVHIDAPELLTGPERTRDTIFTAIMWVVYLYLWVPLVSLFAWWLGVEFAYDVMIRMGGARDLDSILAVYGIIVIVIFCTVAFWSLGNRFRYGRMKRRHAHDDLSIDTMAEFFDVEPEKVEWLRETQSVAIEFDPEGRPVIEPLTRAPS